MGAIISICVMCAAPIVLHLAYIVLSIIPELLLAILKRNRA